MIILNIELDNIYMFNNTFFDFTYSKKRTNSTINNEYLEEFPNINFKRVNILMGANASGKTSFGKVLRDLLNYLSGRNIEHLSYIINNKSKSANIKLTYILPDKKTINSIEVFYDSENIKKEIFKSIELKKSWSLKIALEKLKNSKPIFDYDINNKNEDILNPGLKSIAVSKGVELISPNTQWYFQFSDGGDYSLNFRNQNIELLNRVLKNFDNSIDNIKLIEDDTYLIKFKNNDLVIVEKGKMINKERLSRGTQEAIEVSSFLNAIINLNKNESGTFYLDEKMAYSHSEIEIAIVNLIIEKLNKYSQFFYTTHNYDLLEINLPTHSFLFLKKENNEIKVVYPEKLKYTKNDRSLLNYVKNDVFGTLPSTHLIEELLYE